jgi:RNA polymerase sigma-70 factor, ECF subfamily
MAMDHSFAIVMSKLKAGDQQAAAEIFRRFVHRLVALASRQFEDRFRSKVDPEDVVQSVYQSFFRRNDRSPFELSDWDSLWALLATITVRKCYDHHEFWRAAKRDVRRETQPDPDPTAETWWTAIDREPTPFQATVLADTLEQVIRELEPQQRTIAELTLQGYTAVEIALRCDCSERTVARVIHRIRQRMLAMEAAEFAS